MKNLFYLLAGLEVTSALNTIALTGRRQSSERIRPEQQGKRAWKRASGTVPSTNGPPLDRIYAGTVELGTPPQSFLVQFDMREAVSSDLWVSDEFPDDPTANTTAHRKFQPSASSTFVGSQIPWNISYGEGYTTDGFVAQDTLTIAGFTIPNSGFGLANHTTTIFEQQVGDGIIGLGFVQAQNNQTTFMENLVAGNGGTLDQNYFSIFLARDYTIKNTIVNTDSSGTFDDSNSDGGEICIGCSNLQHYRGDLKWVPVTSHSYWAVDTSGLTYKGRTIDGTKCRALLAAGYDLALPPSVIQAYAQGIGAQIEAVGNGGPAYQITTTCANLATMRLGFDIFGQVYDIAPLDIFYKNNSDLCSFFIYTTDAQDTDRTPMALLGAGFLKNWYTAYSFNPNNEHYIGFAQAIQPNSGSLAGSGLPGTDGTAPNSGGSYTPSDYLCQGNCHPPSHVGLIVGCAVGGAVALILILLLAFCLRRRYRRARTPPSEPPNRESISSPISVPISDRSSTLYQTSDVSHSYEKGDQEQFFQPFTMGQVNALQVTDMTNRHQLSVTPALEYQQSREGYGGNPYPSRYPEIYTAPPTATQRGL
ncbi:acid protease [Atractiella rhizophila]|nr:acid protease [Atractiella rhizophila]